MDSGSMIKISEIVESYLNEIGEYNDVNYVRYLRLAVEGLTQLNIFHVAKVSRHEGYANARNVLLMPDDCIDYIVVGFDHNGEIVPFTKNTNLSIPSDLACGFEATNDALLSDWSQKVTTQHPVGTGRHSVDFNWDKTAKKMYFGGDVTNVKIVVLYMSTGISLTGETLVPVEYTTAIKDYIYFTLVKRDRKTYASHIAMAKQNYEESMAMVRRFHSSFTYSEVLDVLRSGYSPLGLW